MAIATIDDLKKKYGWSDDRAQTFLDDILRRALNNVQGCKDNRPWHIVDFTKMLDPKKPWIGFEFETGFNDNGDYQKFINFLWGQDYTAIDKEGTGKYPVEVAFAPMLAEDCVAGKSTLEAAIQFIHDAGLKPALNPTTFTRRDVGCHAGVSTAKFRVMGGGRWNAATASVVERLDKILLSLSDKQRAAVYNRSALHWGGCNHRGSYIEVKTFKAVPTIEAVQKYIRVSNQIVKLVDLLIDDPKLTLTQAQAFEFLSTTTDKVK